MLPAPAQYIDSSLIQNRAFFADAFEFCHIMQTGPQPSLGRGGKENLMNHPFKDNVTPHVSDRWLPSGDCAERSRTPTGTEAAGRIQHVSLPFPPPQQCSHFRRGNSVAAPFCYLRWNTSSTLDTTIFHSFILPHVTVSITSPLLRCSIHHISRHHGPPSHDMVFTRPLFDVLTRLPIPLLHL